ncbi:hypothetical protein EDWATA_03335 [Edwardsiella tarda ATCC 23685]|uniref:Uncharacterized protein n=1 Tax=Edwardsiella tarda ATCC 23685 TaxID=500638 RepID=D4F977_EDWTA|nr:hypothetical protein EDWATA_03335 [Edwardsiella tarda ATCC 23685]
MRGAFSFSIVYSLVFADCISPLFYPPFVVNHAMAQCFHRKSD